MSAPARTPLARALRRRLLRCPDLIPPGSRVLVALSGGRDSVALLHLLRFGRVVECDLVAAHFDHAMRPGSDLDHAWARGLARAWRVRLDSARNERTVADEAGARALRYAFLRATADRSGADRIATAHHADDQVETVLFRLLRGTGLAGAAGIPDRRGAVVRPLLPFSGRRVAEYARTVGLRWREDPSNLDGRFARNRLRRQVLPGLESAAPGSRRALLHLARRAREAEGVLHPLIEAAVRTVVSLEGGSFVLARAGVLAYDPWIRARVIRDLLQRVGAPVDRPTLRRIEGFLTRARSGAVLELAGGFRLAREFEHFVLFRPVGHVADRPLLVGAEAGTGTAIVGGRRVRLVWGPHPAGEGTAAALDRAVLRFPLSLRGWRPGDRIRLAYGSKKLKKLFAEHRLARSERSRVPVLADAAGRVLWVAGVAIASPAAGRPGHTTLHFTVLE